jgi:hypothetical protein
MLEVQSYATTTQLKTRCTENVSFVDDLNPPDFTGFETHLDSTRVYLGISE